MGIIKMGAGCAFNVISKFLTETYKTIDDLSDHLNKEIGSYPDTPLNPEPLYTPRTKKVVDLSTREAAHSTS
jgi:hypothetical protein